MIWLTTFKFLSTRHVSWYQVQYQCILPPLGKEDSLKPLCRLISRINIPFDGTNCFFNILHSTKHYNNESNHLYFVEEKSCNNIFIESFEITNELTNCWFFNVFSATFIVLDRRQLSAEIHSSTDFWPVFLIALYRWTFHKMRFFLVYYHKQLLTQIGMFESLFINVE